LFCRLEFLKNTRILKNVGIDKEPLHHLQVLIENESSKTFAVIRSYGTCS